MPASMPGRTALLDDRWGLGWRVRNAVRRTSARRTARFWSAFVRGVHHDRPIFVIGAPRSGTTMLFHLLRESSSLGALPGEGHDIWRAMHHPRWSGWESDCLGPGAVRPGERRFVNARFGAYFDEQRFVEKTPENSLRIPYLLDLFPDALFVALRRNPCDVVSSLINGWRDPGGRYRSYFVPQDLQIPGYPHPRRWCFALIEGWREHVTDPIPEIAFAQWDQCAGAVEAGRAWVPPDRWHDVWFEDLLDHPGDATRRICASIGVEVEPAIERKLGDLIRRPVNALTPPGDEKWRRDNPREVGELLPRIAAAVRGRGYLVDPASGHFELDRQGPSPGGSGGARPTTSGPRASGDAPRRPGPMARLPYRRRPGS